MRQSEVARLKQQIEDEYQAARRGMAEFAEGPARHAFIQRKMTLIGDAGIALGALIGESEAVELVFEKLGSLVGEPGTM